ncbi:MAG TPA: IS3 family transposase [Acidimicrobiales bacterium]|nr:IS3 family transposase [Acidimicrobiales bacterium]
MYYFRANKPVLQRRIEPGQFTDEKVLAFCERLPWSAPSERPGASTTPAPRAPGRSSTRVFYRHSFATIAELRAGTARYINFYNHQRRCAKAEHLRPIRYELASARRQQVA